MSPSPTHHLDHPDRPIELVPDLPAALRHSLAAHPNWFVWAVERLLCPVRSSHDMARLIDDTAQAAVAALPAAGWAGITLRFDDTPFTATATAEVVLAVDAAQYTAGDGPCLQAVRTGHLVRVDSDQLHAEFPDMAEGAAAAGVASVMGVPVGDEPDGPRGSINLYSARAAGFSDDETDLALVLAGLLGRGLIEYTALSDARTRGDQLQEAMAHRGVIEQAKGILMAVHQINETDAFAQLKNQSQHHNTKLHTVATDFVAAHTAHPLPSAPTPAVDTR